MALRTHDVLCIVSLVTLIGYSIALLIGTVDGGIGLHVTEVTPEQLMLGLKSFFSSQFFWGISICAFRLAILLLYLEVFGRARWFRWAAWTAITIVCLFYVGALATTLRLCSPIALNWDLSLQGTCGDQAEAEMWAAAINMILDVGIVALPLPIVWRLKLQTRRKVAISVTFGLGMGIAAINLARIIKVLDCSLAADFTYCTSDSAILTVAEMAVGIMVACVPKLGHLFRRGAEAKAQAGSSVQALRDKKYVFGKGPCGISGTSQESARLPFHGQDITESSEAIHYKAHQIVPIGTGESRADELSLELGSARTELDCYAAYSPVQTHQLQSSIVANGIHVARNFEVSAAKSDRIMT